MDPELEERMHPQMVDFLKILEDQDKAQATKNKYRKGLEDYSDWLEEEGLSPEDVTPRDLQRYLSWLKDGKEFAPKTIRAKFVAVRRFYDDLGKSNGSHENPAEKVALADYAPRKTRKEEATKERRVWLPKSEVEQLVRNVPAPKLRNRLVVLFQYYTGLRRQEVSDVKLEDLDRENRKVQVHGKGGKTHTAHWQPKLDGLLSAWIDGGYRKASPYGRESEHLFVTRSSPRLSGDQINQIVKQAAENAGIQEVLFTDSRGWNHYKVTSHILRHSFAMHWLQNGGSIEGLSKNLAHSSVTTTEIYGEILEERASEEYERFAPDIEI